MASAARATRAARRPPANPRRRARALMIGTLVVFSVFAAQLFRVQAFDASATRKDASAKRAVGSTIPAMRGRILDTNGVVLASSVERFTVNADPKALATYLKTAKTEGDPNAYGAQPAAAQVAPLLGMPVDQVTRLFSIDPKRPENRYVQIAKDVTPQTWGQIKTLGIPGLSVDRTAARQYPTGFAGGALVGYVLPADQAPGDGVELLMNNTLKGTTGKIVGEMAANGALIPGSQTVDQPAVNGSDVTLTLDSDLQFFAENALAQQVINTDAESGTVVVMEVATGKIRACPTYPSVDPNDIGKAVKANLANRCFGESFEPGSTGKAMTMAAALETNAVTASTGVIVPNRLPRAGEPFKDNEDHPIQNLTAAGVIAKSSKIGTMLIGERVPPATMESFYRKFGIASPTGVGFAGENHGLLAPSATWGKAQRYTVLFGQGYSLNAIQAAGVFQTIANGGVRMPPTLIESTTDAAGQVTAAPVPQGIRVVSTQTAATLSRMLEEVTGPNGTARAARITGYRVAGKTGTADRYVQTSKNSGGYQGFTASFIGYAPADKPKYIVAVFIQAPKQGMFGGQLAGPVFHQVMTYLLQKDGIAPTGVSAPPMAVFPDRPLSEDDPKVLSDKQAKLLGF